MFQTLAQFAFIGWPLAIIGVIGLVLAFVLVGKQRAVEANTGFDDPDDDPEVQRLSKLGRLALWAGVIIGLIGVVILVSPAWATII